MKHFNLKQEMAFMAMLAISVMTLWDWQSAYLFLFAGLFVLIFPIIFATIDFMEIKSNHIRLPKYADHVDLQTAEFWRWILLGAVFLNWAVLMIAIIGYRDHLFDVEKVFAPVSSLTGAIFLNIDNLPTLMHEKGFGARGKIVQIVSSIGILGAVPVAFLYAYLRICGYIKLNKIPKAVSMWQFLKVLLILTAITYVIMWALTWPNKNLPRGGVLFFEGYKTSNLSLLLRYWIWPTLTFLFLAVFYAEFIRRTQRAWQNRLSAKQIAHRLKTRLVTVVRAPLARYDNVNPKLFYQHLKLRALTLHHIPIGWYENFHAKADLRQQKARLLGRETKRKLQIIWAVGGPFIVFFAFLFLTAFCLCKSTKRGLEHFAFTRVRTSFSSSIRPV